MESLPEELITNILLRLPLKSIGRFRCVAKPWLSFTSTPKFVKSHLTASANNNESRIIAQLGQNNLKEFSVSSLLCKPVTRAHNLDCPLKTSRFRVVGSVNGLICVTSGETTKTLYLWNPTINKFKELPDSKAGDSFQYSFGYDERNDDYKVVGVSYMFDSFGVIIYSRNSGSWSKVDNPPGLLLVYNKQGVPVNGKLHWASHDASLREIVTFDFADDKWGKLRQPPLKKGVSGTLGVLGNYLSVFCDNNKTRGDVWVMKEYGVEESWMKMFSIKCPYEEDSIMQWSPPFWLSNNGEILFKMDVAMFMFHTIILIYNPKDGSIRSAKVADQDRFQNETIYIETLVEPSSKDATTAKDESSDEGNELQMLGTGSLPPTDCLDCK